MNSWTPAELTKLEHKISTAGRGCAAWGQPGVHGKGYIHFFMNQQLKIQSFDTYRKRWQDAGSSTIEACEWIAKPKPVRSFANGILFINLLAYLLSSSSVVVVLF